MNNRSSRSALLGLVTFVAAISAASAQGVGELACSSTPPLHYDTSCTAELVGQPGNAVEPKTGRSFFLDFPCDRKADEDILFILSLHGAGAIGGRGVRMWEAANDDEYLKNIVELVIDHFGLDKGHTEGLEPRVTEALIAMMASARGGKIARQN